MSDAVYSTFGGNSWIIKNDTHSLRSHTQWKVMRINVKIHVFFFAFFVFTVSPESIVIPIVSCIFGFPLLALLVICCLRHRAKMARERDRRRNYDLQDHAVSLVRFSPIHRLSKEAALIGIFIIRFGSFVSLFSIFVSFWLHLSNCFLIFVKHFFC